MVDPDWCGGLLSTSGGEPQWHYKVPLAWVAIKAMREPTAGMLSTKAISDLGGLDRIDSYLDNFSADEIWRAMIDAALSPRTSADQAEEGR